MATDGAVGFVGRSMVLGAGGLALAAVTLVGPSGCWLAHERGSDPVMQCRPLPAITAPPCTSLALCTVRVDERAPGPRGAVRPQIDLDVAGRPVMLVDGALLTRGDATWIEEPIDAPMVAGAFVPGVDTDGAPCTTVLADGGRGVVAILEHRADGDVEVARAPGALGSHREVLRTPDGILALVERDGATRLGHVGPGTTWVDVPVPGDAATLVRAGDEAVLAWVVDHEVRHATVDVAALRSGVAPTADRLAQVLATPTWDLERIPALRAMPSLAAGRGATPGALASGPAGDALAWSFTDPSQAWATEGGDPNCGVPVPGTECRVEFVAHRALSLVMGVPPPHSWPPPVVVLVDRVSWSGTLEVVATGGGMHAWDADPILQHRISLVAQRDSVSRSPPLELDGDDAALVSDARGSLHVVISDVAGLRYLRLGGP